jgi:SNF2 family DNA or RNA helicase
MKAAMKRAAEEDDDEYTSSGSEESSKRSKSSGSNEGDDEILAKGARLTQLQVEAVEWMTRRETEAGGGILSDEMGLGMCFGGLFFFCLLFFLTWTTSRQDALGAVHNCTA